MPWVLACPSLGIRWQKGEASDDRSTVLGNSSDAPVRHTERAVVGVANTKMMLCVTRVKFDTYAV